MWAFSFGSITDSIEIKGSIQYLLLINTLILFTNQKERCLESYQHEKIV